MNLTLYEQLLHQIEMENEVQYNLILDQIYNDGKMTHTNFMQLKDDIRLFHSGQLTEFEVMNEVTGKHRKIPVIEFDHFINYLENYYDLMYYCNQLT